ncbi:MAG: UbiA family prenyltransferase [Syntrophotaleaceae bacterium]
MIAGLLRIRLCAAVAAAALAGWLLCPDAPLAVAPPMALGALLLAMAGTMLNQVQERHSDARMLRTRNRPLATGILQPRTVIIAAVVVSSLGLALLARCDSRSAVAGAIALLCYNGLYTPLKRHTTLALLPGACCGSLAPVLGWLAGGGQLSDYRLILLSGLLLLWQLPHFWLLALRHQADLQRAGLFPDLPLHPAGHLLGLIFLWTFALSVATLLLAGLHILPGWLAGTLCLTVWIGPLKQWRSVQESISGLARTS